jgi:hypothetical protein
MGCGCPPRADPHAVIGRPNLSFFGGPSLVATKVIFVARHPRIRRERAHCYDSVRGYVVGTERSAAIARRR